MARKRNQVTHRTSDDLRAVSDYYKLHTKAADDLVGATKENTPQYSEEELRKYRGRHGIKLPEWLKIVLVKAWFAGAVCFFIFWGLGMYVADALDMLAVLGMVLGLTMDLLVNSIFRYYEETPGANDKWMMFPKKKYSHFFMNIVYGFVLLVCVYTLYQFINGTIVMITGNRDTVPLGVEPILFGLFYTGFDLLFIGLKHILLQVISDAKHSAK